MAVHLMTNTFIAYKIIHVALRGSLRTLVQIPHTHLGKRLKCSRLISVLRDLFTSEGGDLPPTLSTLFVAFSKLATMRGFQ